MLFKVKKGQSPYYVIERYIYEHSKVVEEMIAVLEIDGVRTNELLEVDEDYDGWIWLNDWWEGEPEISLIDFYPVSQACNPKNAIPVRHGKWIYGNDFHWYTASCNVCGYQRRTDIKADRWNQWNYCPNCGAKMDGEQEKK